MTGLDLQKLWDDIIKKAHGKFLAYVALLVFSISFAVLSPTFRTGKIEYDLPITILLFGMALVGLYLTIGKEKQETQKQDKKPTKVLKFDGNEKKDESKRNTIDALKKQIRHMRQLNDEYLEGPKFKRWRFKTERILSKAFGENSAQVKKFNAKFEGLEEKDFEEDEYLPKREYIRLLDEIRDVLKICVEELEGRF